MIADHGQASALTLSSASEESQLGAIRIGRLLRFDLQSALTA
jgi:hypothetical protein